MPAHYLQNAFLPVGTTSLPPGVLEPVTGPIEVDPQRLLTYFQGVLQIGQSLAFWSDASVAAAADMVARYKASTRRFLAATANYYRLWEQPGPGGAPAAGASTTPFSGCVYEDRGTHEGYIYVKSQSALSATIALSRASGWPVAVPAPWFVRQAAVPSFEVLEGSAVGTTFAVDRNRGLLVITVELLGDQAILLFRPGAAGAASARPNA